jgi:hypothetical protein
LAGEANEDDAGLLGLLADVLMGDAEKDSRETAAAAAGEGTALEVCAWTPGNALLPSRATAGVEEEEEGAAANAENESNRCLADALPLLPLPPLAPSLSLEADEADSAGAAASACRCPGCAGCDDNDTVGDANGELAEVLMEVSMLEGIAGLRSSG